MDMLVPNFWLPLVGETIRLYAFYQYCKARLGVDNLPFAFPKVVLNAYIYEVSPDSAVVPASYASSLGLHTGSLSPFCGGRHAQGDGHNV